MKKSFFIIVCLMLAMTSQVYADEVVIPLTELTQGSSLGGDEPMDDPEQGGDGHINNFHATIIDRTLFITSETTDTSHLMVRRIANGDIIVNRDFVTSTSATMPTSGVYHLRIESGHHIFTGNINVP